MSWVVMMVGRRGEAPDSPTLQAASYGSTGIFRSFALVFDSLICEDQDLVQYQNSRRVGPARFERRPNMILKGMRLKLHAQR
jgi:hypothetical protein